MAVEDGGRRCREKAPKARYLYFLQGIDRGELRQGMLAPIAALAANPTQTTQDQ
jgi:hypothetical protein